MYDTYDVYGPSDQQRADHRREAAEWAAEVLADDRLVLLDTETTDKVPDLARIVEIAIASPTKGTLLNTRVNPGIPIPEGARRIHKISDADIADKPSFGDILPLLTQAITDRRVVIYNATYDTAVIRAELCRHFATLHAAVTVDAHVQKWYETTRSRWGECAMRQAAAWRGIWNPDIQAYRWPKLSDLVPTTADHSALGDCRATWKLLRGMATSTKPAPTII